MYMLLIIAISGLLSLNRSLASSSFRPDTTPDSRMTQLKIMDLIGKTEIAPYENNLVARESWDSLKTRLRAIYGRLGYLTALQWEVGHFTTQGDWSDLGPAYCEYYKAVGDLDIYSDNALAWEIFNHIAARRVLKMALHVMSMHTGESEDCMDTYANLLYKLGHRADAIEWEQQAIDRSTSLAVDKRRTPTSLFQNTLRKMQDNQPTWPGGER